ncbi:glycosyl hydrolase family 18 protein [Persicirhabdus sediminis]|uniref:chitinase n=1 Tax=Persicirhabdus sediminis TaxID=454144 RepID=A0A8J7MDQ8_9BACT|nr:glycosyl hydrolase family 18 protein [Persicirhabdus sediminis]MBK1791018.1 lytic polysaccharide monooxygenase [Persicirhabdus sediminis]
MKRLSYPFLLSTLCLLTSSANLSAHGTVADPISRVYSIFQEGPANPKSASAIAAVTLAGSNQYYTWNQISLNVANYDDAIFNESYASVVPDGQLASAGNREQATLNFAGLDLFSNTWDWPTTQVSAGPMTIDWIATATHDPSFFKVWISKEGFNPKQAITWDDLEFLGKFGTDAYSKEGQHYYVPITLPERTGQHVLYVAWQRIDPVGEVFFSLSDITFGGSSVIEGDPVVSISNLSVNESNSTATFNVTLSKAVEDGKIASVDFATSDITATAGVDYTSTSGTLNFAAGEISKTIVIPIIDDELEESDESLKLTLSSATGLLEGQMSAQLSITDNDSTAAGGFRFTVTDDWGTGYSASLKLVNNDATAWTSSTVVIEIELNNPNFWGIESYTVDGNVYTITLPANNVPIAAGGSYTFGWNSQSNPVPPLDVSIGSNDLELLPPSVSIADSEIDEGDSTFTSSVAVNLSGEHTESIFVSYITVDGDATADTDFTATSGTLEFAPGETTKSINVEILGNRLIDEDRSFSIQLAGVDGETVPVFTSSQDSQATITILDDDGPVSLTAFGDIVIEGDSGSENMTFTVKLDRAVKSDEVVSFDYTTSGMTATAGSDFTTNNGSYTFAEGEQETTINVSILGDTLDERLEKIHFTLSNVSGGYLVTHHVVGQIIDNEIDNDAFGRQRVVAYIDGTSGTLNIPDPNRVTHIMYAFADLNTDGSLKISESAISHFATLNQLKAQNPELKILVSVGGWTWSANFASVADTEEGRTTFAQSCRDAVNDYNLDGIDVDWEWPGVNGGPGTTPTAKDGPNYTQLIAALRAELDAQESLDDLHYEITAFTAASPNGIAQLELAKLAPLFDFVNAQGYDLHGAWDDYTGHNAGLHDNSADPASNLLNIEAVLAQYEAGGFPRSKLLVGAPFYGRVFYGVHNTANGAFQSHSGSGSAPLYRDLSTQIANMPRYWDAYAKVPYLYDSKTGVWISYDDPEAMLEKAKYSRQQGYGGIFYWSNRGDTDRTELLLTISDGLALVDSDNDTIDDGWEILWFGNLTTATKTSNFDGDELTDIAEYFARLDPLSPQDEPALSLPELNNGEPTIKVQTEKGVFYQLEKSDSLDDWQALGEKFEGTGQLIELSAIPQGETLEEKAFYRLVFSDK